MDLFFCPDFFDKFQVFCFLVLQRYIPSGMLKYLFQKGGSKKKRWRQKKNTKKKHKKKQHKSTMKTTIVTLALALTSVDAAGLRMQTGLSKTE